MPEPVTMGAGYLAFTGAVAIGGVITGYFMRKEEEKDRARRQAERERMRRAAQEGVLAQNRQNFRMVFGHSVIV